MNSVFDIFNFLLPLFETNLRDLEMYSEKKEKLKKLRAEVRELEQELMNQGESVLQNSFESTTLNDIIDPSLHRILPEMVFVFNENGVFLDYHVKNIDNLLVSADKIRGAKIEAVLPESLAKLTHQKLRYVLEKKEVESYCYNLKIDGKILQYEAEMMPFAKNQVIAVVKHVPDVENVLQNAVKERDYLYGIMNSGPVGILHLTESGNVIFANSELLSMFHKNKFIAYESCDLCDKIFGEKHFDITKGLKDLEFLSDKPVSLQRRVDFEDNEKETIYVLIHILRKKNPINHEFEFVLYVENITEFIEIQTQLNQKVNELELTQKIGKISYWEFDIKANELRGFSPFLTYFPELNLTEKLSAEQFFEIVHPDDKAKIHYLFKNQTGKKRDVVEQFRLLIKGKEIWVEVNSVRNYLVGDVDYPLIQGSVQDITKQKEQEERLYQNQKLLDVLMEKLPVAVFAKEAKTRKYSLWNKASEILFEMKKQDIIGKTDSQIHHETFSNLINERDDQCLQSGMSLEFLDERIEVNGTEKYIKLFQMPISLHGSYSVIVGIAIDNTTKKLVEKELLNAKEQAEKSDNLKSSFLANMSHEIRNPMNAIIGFSKILVEDEALSAEEKKEFTELINANAKQLLRLISDIIDITKIENNKLKIFKKHFSVNNSLNRLKSMYDQILIEEEKTDIDLILKTDLPNDDCQIETDEQRFQQIMGNLLSNAIRFTDTGFIEFGYRHKKPNVLEFYVKDTGIGISATEQVKIFNKFHQVGATSTGSTGKGLGLSISLELVKYLGGKLWVESSPKSGSCFYFTLPKNVNREVPSLSQPTQALFSKITDEFTWDDKSILIVDDRDDILSFVKILLKKTQIRVITASNGKEAVEIIKKEHEKIDAVFMDIQMPIMNGVEAMKIIKSTYPEIRVVAQTAFALEGDAKKFLELGFDNYISKPINKKHLMKILSGYFGT